MLGENEFTEAIPNNNIEKEFLSNENTKYLLEEEEIITKLQNLIASLNDVIQYLQNPQIYSFIEAWINNIQLAYSQAEYRNEFNKLINKRIIFGLNSWAETFEQILKHLENISSLSMLEAIKTTRSCQSSIQAIIRLIPYYILDLQQLNEKLFTKKQRNSEILSSNQISKIIAKLHPVRESAKRLEDSLDIFLDYLIERPENLDDYGL